MLSAGPAPAQPAAAGPRVLPRGGADLWIPALAGLALALVGILMRHKTRLWERAVRIVGFEATRALSAALLICGVAVFVAPWAVVAATGRAANATQAQALSSWDETVLQSPSSAPQLRAEDERMVLSIPSLGLRRFVPNDATVDHLKAYGVGWIPGTALPGADGVVGIAGHRTTYGAPFFRLDRLAEGDAILIDYRGKRFAYRVERFETVSPTQVEVLQGAPDQRMIALITCTPAYSAASRLVVFGRLEAVGLRGNGQ